MIKHDGQHVFADMLRIPTYTVATAPDATQHPGGVIYVTNGNAGDPGMAFSNGTDWLLVDDLTAISDS